MSGGFGFGDGLVMGGFGFGDGLVIGGFGFGPGFWSGISVLLAPGNSTLTALPCKRRRWTFSLNRDKLHPTSE